MTFKTKVEHTYQISITDGDKKPSTLVENGAVQSVSYNQQVKYGDSVVLEFLPRNDVDTYFSFASGDISSSSSRLEISPHRNLDLVISNRVYQHENFALNKPVSTNSEQLHLESYGWSTSYLTNEKKSNLEGTNSYTSDRLPGEDVSSNPIWIEVDLGQNTSFDSVKLSTALISRLEMGSTPTAAPAIMRSRYAVTEKANTRRRTRLSTRPISLLLL